jgi:two-component system heavy metal sensor histidine kinase CusS
MIADMLFLAKAEPVLMPPHMEPIDLAAEVGALFEYFEAWAEEQQVSLALEGAARIDGDPLMLRRALSNLLTNAVRSTPAGREVRVRLAETREDVEISIENPGPEISAEALPRLFDRFYRPSSDEGKWQEGAGLGLAIVRSIAAAHGRRVAAASEAGLTRFVVTLPGPRRAQRA